MTSVEPGVEAQLILVDLLSWGRQRGRHDPQGFVVAKRACWERVWR